MDATYDDLYTASAPSHDASRGPVLALRNQKTGAEIELKADRDRWLVGSDPDGDIVVADRFVSKVHCVIERRGGALAVRDRRSKNGTFVNGSPVESAILTPGALLVVGRTLFIALCQATRGRLTAYERLRGSDPAFRGAVNTAIRAASSDCSVLVVGETGTGKELIARALHDASPRSMNPFIAVNCGAIPRELIASELFGHLRGSFTGATSDRDGLFVTAEGGTIFLDEVGELPLDQQPHLLRVLEGRKVRPVGAPEEKPVNVRVVAATNRMRALGTADSPLRLDLYHRLATVVVLLPPLRERAGDIEVLVRGFIAELAPFYGDKVIARTTMQQLITYPWPGNIRELRQSVERAMALCDGELTEEVLLPRALRGGERLPGVGQNAAHDPRLAAFFGIGAGAAPLAVAAPALDLLATGAEATEPLGPEPILPPMLRLAAGSGSAAGKRPLPAARLLPARGGAATAEMSAARIRRLDEITRDVMLDALERAGSVRLAAEALGIPKSTFADRARRLGIKMGR